MCDECVEIQRLIDQHERFLSEPLDPLSKERIGNSLAALKQRKSEMHPLPRPACPKCQMRMIVKHNDAAEQVFECLRCGHVEALDIEGKRSPD
jgi:transcription initiation factor IIE alpha subunit